MSDPQMIAYLTGAREALTRLADELTFAATAAENDGMAIAAQTARDTAALFHQKIQEVTE